MVASYEGLQPIGQMVNVEWNKVSNVDIRFNPTSNLTPSELVEIVKRLDSLDQRLNAVEQAPVKEATPRTKEMQQMAKEIEDIRTTLNPLEKTILDNPEKSLSLPLIRKDITQLQNDIVTIRRDIDRAFDLSKWLIGTIIALAVGLLGSIITLINKKSP